MHQFQETVQQLQRLQKKKVNQHQESIFIIRRKDHSFKVSNKKAEVHEV